MTDKDTDITIELFHANWCGACQRLKPEWDKLIKENGKIISKAYPQKCEDTVAVITLENGKEVKLIEYEEELEEQKEKHCENYKNKFKENNIRGYPTFVVTRNGEKQQESLPRTAQGIKDYLMGKIDTKGGSNKFIQCGAGYNNLEIASKNDKDRYYKMKYFKYKAKYLKLSQSHNHTITQSITYK